MSLRKADEKTTLRVHLKNTQKSPEKKNSKLNKFYKINCLFKSRFPEILQKHYEKMVSYM